MSENPEVTSCDLHNLKSTLTAVMGYIQMTQNNLTQNFSSDQVAKAKELLNKATEAAKKLEIKISQLESGQKEVTEEAE